jgi:hypothetical protein
MAFMARRTFGRLPPDAVNDIERLLRQLDRAEKRAAFARRELAVLAQEWGDSVIAREAGVTRQAVRKWRVTFHNSSTPTASKLT